MKNIFKFMGIALMACSLTFVSCNRDDDDDTNTPVNPNPQPGGASIAVTWDGAAQDIQFISATIE